MSSHKRLKFIKGLASPKHINSKEVIPYLFIIFLTWMSRFLLSNSFGLYEDDWAFSGNAITNTFAENFSRISSALFTFWQGRPLHMSLLTLMPSLGSQLGGTDALYFLGFLILSSNACLIYYLLKRVSYQPYIPIIAALFFCLYPADTTFSYLQHLFGLQTSLLFLLLAFHCYLSAGEGQVYLKILSYLMSIFSLLTYESPFLTYLAAPFLLRNKSKKQIIIHFCIVGISLFSYLVLRKMAGEQRVVGLGTTSLTQTVIYQIFAGPLVAVATYFLRPLEILQQLKHENIFILPLAFSFFYLLINYLFSNERQIANNNNTNQLNIPGLLAIGTAITILAYPSALTLSVNIIDGRASRVHFAASLGTAIILSCLWNYMIIKSSSKQVLRKLTIFLLALHLSLLFVFCLNVQNFYKVSWQNQQEFWSDVTKLSPDLEENTVIIVQAPSLASGKQINPFDWSVPSVLSSIYYFPKSWKYPPRLYILNSSASNIDGWKSMIQKNNLFLMSNKTNSLKYYYEWEPDRKVDPKDVILLVEEKNQLSRKSLLELPNGDTISLKQATGKASGKEYKKSVLFNRLVDNSSENIRNERPVTYFQK